MPEYLQCATEASSLSFRLYDNWKIWQILEGWSLFSWSLNSCTLVLDLPASVFSVQQQICGGECIRDMELS